MIDMIFYSNYNLFNAHFARRFYNLSRWCDVSFAIAIPTYIHCLLPIMYYSMYSQNVCTVYMSEITFRFKCSTKYQHRHHHYHLVVLKHFCSAFKMRLFLFTATCVHIWKKKKHTKRNFSFGFLMIFNLICCLNVPWNVFSFHHWFNIQYEL